MNNINTMPEHTPLKQDEADASHTVNSGAARQHESEKNLLLSLGHDLAAVRNKNDLLTVVTRKLRFIFSSTRFVIDLLDEQMVSHQPYFVSGSQSSVPDEYAERVLAQCYPVNDGLYDQVIGSCGPTTFKVQDLIKKRNITAEYVHFWSKIGLEQITGIPLLGAAETLGVLWISTDKVPSKSLLKGIATQLSIAVANIRVIERIEQREREQALLLAFSNDIAIAINKTELGEVFKRYLKNLFRINEYIITLRNEDQDTFSYFLHELPHRDPDDEGFKFITNSPMTTTRTMTGEVVRADRPVVFDIKEIIEEKKLFFPSASFWKTARASKILGMPLKAVGKTVGILWLQACKINEDLLNGISAQIAIALSNVMAQNKVEKQIEEINQYKERLEAENWYLHREISDIHNNDEIIGSGVLIKRVFNLVAQVAPANSTVLLLGETGTGKELIARAIHNSSPRKDKLLVKVNCAALPASLIESELFGHEKGSFTGAIERRTGKFELANKGTLFLDEIGEMPLELQTKLLRALQEREIERVGGKSPIKVDVRIIAATNRDIFKDVNEGRFRQDLFYRLNVFPIALPPLRERKEDIPALARHFAAKFAANNGRRDISVTDEVIEQMVEYNWPGNVRELEHVIERTVLLTRGDIIKEIYLPNVCCPAQPKHQPSSHRKTLEEHEREYILLVLEKCKGKISGPGGAAEYLGVPPTTLNSRIKKLSIRKYR